MDAFEILKNASKQLNKLIICGDIASDELVSIIPKNIKVISLGQNPKLQGAITASLLAAASSSEQWIGTTGIQGTQSIQNGVKTITM